jgi:DNA-binding transcriptional regulator YdaS (Cro superfamily)
MTSLTLARGDYIESAALNNGTASEPAEKVLAIIRATESVSEEEISKLEHWLAIRLEVSEVEIIVGE